MGGTKNAPEVTRINYTTTEYEHIMYDVCINTICILYDMITMCVETIFQFNVAFNKINSIFTND